MLRSPNWEFCHETTIFRQTCPRISCHARCQSQSGSPPDSIRDLHKLQPDANRPPNHLLSLLPVFPTTQTEAMQSRALLPIRIIHDLTEKANLIPKNASSFFPKQIFLKTPCKSGKTLNENTPPFDAFTPDTPSCRCRCDESSQPPKSCQPAVRKLCDYKVASREIIPARVGGQELAIVLVHGFFRQGGLWGEREDVRRESIELPRF